MPPAATATPEPTLQHPHYAGVVSSTRAVTGRVIVALWIAAIIYVVALSSLIARGAGLHMLVSDPLLEQVILLLLWGVATPGIIWLAERFPIERRTWRRRIAAHGTMAIAFIFALNILAPTFAWLVRGHPQRYADVWRHGLAGFIGAGHLALIVYAFILGAGHYLHTLDVRRAEQLRAERLRADLASAQLRVLTLQLQPHFLFNALNAVSALIITGRNREAFDVVGRLGELLRALLAIDRRDEVSLREELELAQSYVGIEQARLGERLRVSWDIGAEIDSAQVPPMLLQPLVENAIRHGVARLRDGGDLTICARRAESRLVLDVSDNGPGPSAGVADEQPGMGVGLDHDAPAPNAPVRRCL